MKYIVLVGDGMADEPLLQLGGKTPLEHANIPNMDRLAKGGEGGLVKTVPDGFPAGSDVANLSILGYDPRSYYAGRAPLEAASMGVSLRKNEIGFRCNLVTVKDGEMSDFAAGHIKTDEAKGIIERIDRELGNDKIRFYPGVSYRHLTVIDSSLIPNLSSITYTPPHNITGLTYKEFLPKAGLIKDLMEKSHAILKDREYANMIWLWGEGKAVELPLLTERFGISGTVISAIDLVKGLGILSGLRPIDVPGATGYYDTDYEAKARYGLCALKDYDLLFLHVESPDEAGHNKDLKEKIRAIENFDEKVVGRILDGLAEDFRILVLSDHPTPVASGKHSSDPTPFTMYGKGIEPDRMESFCEKEAKKGIFIEEGFRLIDRLIYGNALTI
ncbi:MAG: cofactor-independent phosphoglycerate mutase [bacterium]|nr:cofactor-independent phosphoglycerate mutase [bacterium]